MDLLKVLLLIGDPLLMAFVSSVILGIALKNSPTVLFVKRIVSLAVFGAYFILYFYLVFVVGGIAMYIGMFAPLAVILIFIIISIIAAPKGTIKEDSDKEFKMTGWDTMFPNDIDNDNNYHSE